MRGSPHITALIPCLVLLCGLAGTGQGQPPDPSCVEKESVQTGLTCADFKPCPTCHYTCYDMIVTYNYDCKCTCENATTTETLQIFDTDAPETQSPGTTAPKTGAPLTNAPPPPVPRYIITSSVSTATEKDIERNGVLISVTETNGASVAALLKTVSSANDPIITTSSTTKGSKLDNKANNYVTMSSQNISTIIYQLGPYPVGTLGYAGETLIIRLTSDEKVSVSVPVQPLKKPPLSSEEVETTTQATTGVASVLAGGSGVASLGVIGLVKDDCLRMRDLSTFMHPTGIQIDGNAYLGCSAANTALSLSLFMLHVMLLGITSCIASHTSIKVPIFGAGDRKAENVKTSAAAVRFPSVSVIGILFLYPGVTLCSWRVLFTVGDGRIVIGIFGCFMSVFYPVMVARLVKNASRKMVHKKDPKIQRPMIWLIGPGEWVNASPVSLTRQRVGVLFHESKGGKAWFVNVTLSCTLFLGVIRGIPLSNANQCSIGNMAMSGVMWIAFIITVKTCPRNRIWDQFLLSLELLLQGVALLLSSIGYSGEQPEDATLFYVSALLVQIATIVVIIRTLLDVISEFLVILILGRRNRLQAMHNESLQKTHEEDGVEFMVLNEPLMLSRTDSLPLLREDRFSNAPEQMSVISDFLEVQDSISMRESSRDSTGSPRPRSTSSAHGRGRELRRPHLLQKTRTPTMSPLEGGADSFPPLTPVSPRLLSPRTPLSTRRGPVTAFSMDGSVVTWC